MELWLLLSISSLGGAGCRSWIRDGGLTYFDLSTASADFEAWLWVHGWSVNDMAIFKVKLGSVIGTHNAITHERTLRKRAYRPGRWRRSWTYTAITEAARRRRSH